MLDIYNLLSYCIMGGGGGGGRWSKLLKPNLNYLSKNHRCWYSAMYTYSLASYRSWMQQCICNSPFLETHISTLRRHQTISSVHWHVSKIARLVTNPSKTDLGGVVWFQTISKRKTVNFLTQNSFQAVFWLKGNLDCIGQKETDT